MAGGVRHPRLVFWALVAIWMCVGCANGETMTWDRCSSTRVIDACNVADYPPLTAMLPPWPFSGLLVPIEAAEAMAAPKPVETPAGRILRKLGS